MTLTINREWKLGLKWKAMYMVPVMSLPLAEKAGRLLRFLKILNMW